MKGLKTLVSITRETFWDHQREQRWIIKKAKIGYLLQMPDYLDCMELLPIPVDVPRPLELRELVDQGLHHRLGAINLVVLSSLSQGGLIIKLINYLFIY